MLLEVPQVHQVTSGLEVVVQNQVVSLAHGRAPLTALVVRGVHVLAELVHEHAGVLRPYPFLLLGFRHGVVGGFINAPIQQVRLVVQLLDQPKRNRGQVPGLLRVLEELYDALQEDEELGRVCQDLLVLGTVDIDSELERLVKLVVQLLNEGHKELLLPMISRGVLTIIVIEGIAVRRGPRILAAALLVLLISLLEQGHHEVDLVQGLVPHVDAHGCECTACVVEIHRDH
mmetsp:Transcript_123114/g.274960  ORF Transcript_123114/g.274960 Transcript_123114/m.274960 type:complete len:230 (-) Transcript_123114:1401-2090(-)